MIHWARSPAWQLAWMCADVLLGTFAHVIGVGALLGHSLGVRCCLLAQRASPHSFDARGGPPCAPSRPPYPILLHGIIVRLGGLTTRRWLQWPRHWAPIVPQESSREARDACSRPVPRRLDAPMRVRRRAEAQACGGHHMALHSRQCECLVPARALDQQRACSRSSFE